MEVFLAVCLLIAVIVGCIMLKVLIRKGVDAAATALNKNVLFKSEYQEQQQLLSTTLTFVTTAPENEIMRALTNYIAPVQTIPMVEFAIYQLSAMANTVVYAYGSNLYAKRFVASVSLTNTVGGTQSTFKFLSWHEYDGMLSNLENMKKLRNNIISAFTSADASVRITEGTVNINFVDPIVATNNSNAFEWRCSCGTNNSNDDTFCVDCGYRKPDEQ